ncbi:hypothetical protein AAY473_009303 [Plecturocebus cupreus]
MPVIPALWEAEAGGLLAPRSFTPAWATRQDHTSTKKFKNWLGTVVAYACNPSTLGGHSPYSRDVEQMRIQELLN